MTNIKSVRIRYSLPNPITGFHDTAEEVTLGAEGADSPENAVCACCQDSMILNTWLTCPTATHVIGIYDP